MKKLVLMAVVIAIAAPAMAALDFTIAAGANPGEIVIGYTNNDGTPDHPRGIAIEVEITSGDATFEADAFVTHGGVYNVFPDWLSVNQGWFPGKVKEDLPGAGSHPLADPDAKGVFAAPGTRLAISAGFLDNAGGQAAKTDATVELVTLLLTDLTPASSSWVTITADDTRTGAGGTGAVGSVVSTTFPAAFEVTFELPCSGCFPCDDVAERAMWEQVGVYAGLPAGTGPDSWCYKFQCVGDADGGFVNKDKDGKRIWVSGDDLNILVLGWQKFEDHAEFANFVGADYDHAFVNKDKDGKRIFVSGDDLDILVLGWQAFDTVGGSFEPGTFPCPGIMEGTFN